MLIETTRFGVINVENNDIISFPQGMLGFSKIHEYVLVERTDDSLFIWLQALKKASIAFPLLEPQLFEHLSYKIELEENDRKILELDDIKYAKVFTIITIPSDPTKMTANMRAPIVINLQKRLAHQVILQRVDYPIRKSIFLELQKYCSRINKNLFSSCEGDVKYQTVHIVEEKGEEVSVTKLI